MRCLWFVSPALPALLPLAAVMPCLPARGQEGGKEAVVEKCKADLVQRAQVAVTDITVAKVEEVVWPDGSLGCPEPGKDYIMMLIPGYRITLQVAEKSYEYHTDRPGRRVVYCANPPPEAAPARPPRPPEESAPTEAAGPPARAVVLLLEDIPNEPNLNRRLVARNPADPGAEPQTVLDLCSGFVVSEGGVVLAKRRTSRSTHELIVVTPGAAPKVIMRGFDFEGMTWLGPSADYVVLAAAAPGARWQLYGGHADRAPTPLDWVPAFGRARGAALSCRQSLLLVSAPTAEDTAEREVTVLDMAARKVLGTFRSAEARLGVFVGPGPSAVPQ